MKWLISKVVNLITYGEVTNVTDDTFDYPVSQISYLGRSANAQRISPYGLSSNPPQNIKVIHWNILAQEENKASMAFSQKDRFKNLKPGEVVIGNPESGSHIKFLEDGKIEIISKGDLDITVTGDVNLTVSGDVNVDATQVNLGVAGANIARLGDQVTTMIGGSPTVGTITSAGINTSI